MRLRVVVYNVRGFRGGLANVTKVVGRFEPDLVLVNESGSRRRLRRFARTLGMETAADPRSWFGRRVKNAVLVRPPWRLVERRLHRFEPSDALRRGALIAEVGRAGHRVWAIAVHLGLHPAERRRHAEELADLARGLRGAVLIGGDLNETPDGRAALFLGERYWDAWLLGGDVAGETFPAADPTARIDYLFVSEELRVEKVIVPPLPEARTASDHLPVVAELTLGEGPSPSAG